MARTRHGCLTLVVLAVLAASGDTHGELGDVHTSAASVARLVEAEQTVVAALQDYLAREEARLEAIRGYIAGWRGGAADYVHNPLNSYFFLWRLTKEFPAVLDALDPTPTEELRHNLSSLRGGVEVPREADLNGVAFALVRLQDTYNLTVDDLVQGDIWGRKAVHVLSADDCFRLGQQSFNNLEFGLSEQWYNKGLALLAGQQPLTQEEQQRIERVSRQQEHRAVMSKMVTQLAQHSDGHIHDRFSGLGLPISFQQQVYANHEGADSVKLLNDLYRRLCRGEEVQPPQAFIGLKCGYVFGSSAYHRLMPFKAELRWADPIIIVYHDALTEAETEVLKRVSMPRLATTMVHSFTTHQVRKSLARVGKTAWVRRGDDATVDDILRRIEHMTGLTTATAEDLHVLNYGIGGHYDAHVDFFDLEDKAMDKTPHQGDRLATMLFYLNDVEAGGSTVFPTVGVEVAARRGSALFWFNLKRNGRGDYRTVHAACPVLLGEKWIANLWLHEWGQEFRWSCTLNPED
ncbi:prolyl 4-hydroxylase subunit alpha-2-like isoform X2 [Eriocheir sinensis]|uniref:prolyl 4-hydroxylase subunit alpha-2-like isoform X2 n=1 Tax=Eriocheir sinensis TaxID=95602 RepID=UPI0021C726E7|nr:prolyl 4-hydroxylase subunit alpha-2-like isoform X2 [Eriocheir sinensis]